MERYTVKTLKAVLNNLPSDGYLWGNEDLVRLFKPFADTYYIVDGELKFCSVGLPPTKENIAKVRMHSH